MITWGPRYILDVSQGLFGRLVDGKNTISVIRALLARAVGGRAQGSGVPPPCFAPRGQAEAATTTARAACRTRRAAGAWEYEGGGGGGECAQREGELICNAPTWERSDLQPAHSSCLLCMWPRHAQPVQRGPGVRREVQQSARPEEDANGRVDRRTHTADASRLRRRQRRKERQAKPYSLKR